MHAEVTILFVCSYLVADALMLSFSAFLGGGGGVTCLFDWLIDWLVGWLFVCLFVFRQNHTSRAFVLDIWGFLP